jgi:hypothetical protein
MESPPFRTLPAAVTGGREDDKLYCTRDIHQLYSHLIYQNNLLPCLRFKGNRRMILLCTKKVELPH